MEELKCRFCLQDNSRRVITLKDTSGIEEKSYEDIISYICEFSPKFGPQIICRACAHELLAAYKFKRKVEKSEAVWSVQIKPEDVETQILDGEDSIPETSQVFVANIINEPLEVINQPKEIEDSNSDFVWPEENINNKNITPDLTKEIQKRETCPYCENNFKNRAILVKHCRIKHSDKILQCQECPKTFYLPQLLENHFQMKHNVPKRGTSQEKNSQSSQKTSRIRKENTAHTCKYCFKEFKNPYRLHLHKQETHPKEFRPSKSNSKEKSICCHCGKIMLFASLDIHLREVHAEKLFEYTCDLCEAKLNSRNGLITHMKLHLKTKYKCKYCVEIFGRYGAKRNHELRFHESNRLKYECSYCQRLFITKRQWREHTYTHTGERNFACEVCGFQSTTREGLKRHLTTHSDLRPFACAQCSSTFKTKQGLRKHKKCHMEWEYECPVCARKFLVNQAMRIHVTKNHPDYELPPPGTVMNTIAIKKITEISEKYNMPVSASMLSSRKGVDSLWREYMK